MLSSPALYGLQYRAKWGAGLYGAHMAAWLFVLAACCSASVPRSARTHCGRTTKEPCLCAHELLCLSILADNALFLN